MVRGLVKRIKSVQTSIVLLGFPALVALAACSADQPGSENGGKGGYGYVSLGLSADTAYIATKATSDPENADEYKVRIYKGEEIVASFLFGEKEESLPLEAGDYIAKASWGTLVAAAFDSLYVEGESKFTIKDGETTPVKLDCRPMNAKVTVDYDAKVKDAYSDYSVSMSTSHTENSPLVYGKDEMRAGYFRVNKEGEKLNLLMKFVAAGKEYPFTNTVDLKPSDFVRLHLKLKEGSDTPTPDPDDTPAPTLSVNVTGLLLGAEKDLTKEVAVTSNAEWNISNSSDWLTADKQAGKVVFTAKTNTTTEARAVTVTLTAVNESKSTSVDITVFQEGKQVVDNTPKLYVDVIEFAAPGEGLQQQVITVRSTHKWDFTNDGSGWLQVSRAGENNATLTLSAAANTTGQSRIGTIVLTAKNGEGQTATTSIKVTQAVKEEDPYIHVDFSNLRLSHTGIIGEVYKVETNQKEWAVSSSADWMKAEKVQGGISLTVESNPKNEVRSAELTLTATQGVRTVTVKIKVTQDAKPLDVPPLQLEIVIDRTFEKEETKTYIIENLYSTEKNFTLEFKDKVPGEFRSQPEGTAPKDFYLNIVGKNGAKIQKCEWAAVVGFDEILVDLADPNADTQAQESAGLVWDKDLRGQSLATIYLEKFIKGLSVGYHEFKITVTGGGTSEEAVAYSNSIALKIQIVDKQ